MQALITLIISKMLLLMMMSIIIAMIRLMLKMIKVGTLAAALYKVGR